MVRELFTMVDNTKIISLRTTIGEYVTRLVQKYFDAHYTHKYIIEHLENLDRTELANHYIWYRTFYYTSNGEYLETIKDNQQFIQDISEYIDLLLNRHYKKWNKELYHSSKYNIKYHYKDNYIRENKRKKR